ncbi:WW domain-containing oxidoreductase [Lasiodiplodia hormozganensis]|uniref:WW domain-containing oxidoreductase n=1 Tax=Lasiodiplodia hormozganensis TaxID=869390 RepID=A0AA40CIU7_9PEZI|nr:WW domain-containing oxidoreductase [Lasiodiplodia hormozganensis]
MTTRAEFGHDTKAAEVAEAFASQIKGRIVAITGVARTGLGGATAVAFAKHDPELLLLISRTQSKLDEVIADIKAVKPNANVKSVLVDLTSQASVRRAAEEINTLAPRLDILINNAGFWVFTRSVSPEGIESQFAGNHIGHFLLTNLLTDRLLAAAKKSTPGATRVINLSSEGHRVSPVRFHDYNLEGKPVPEEESSVFPPLWPDELVKPNADGYAGMVAYGQSKTANILFSVELNRRLAAQGVVSYAVHPGMIGTDLSRNMDPKTMAATGALLSQYKPKASIEEGASTTLVAAIDPALSELKGIYLSDCHLIDAAPHATDANSAKKLWALSEDLVKQAF